MSFITAISGYSERGSLAPYLVFIPNPCLAHPHGGVNYYKTCTRMTFFGGTLLKFSPDRHSQFPFPCPTPSLPLKKGTPVTSYNTYHTLSVGIDLKKLRGSDVEMFEILPRG